MDALEAKILPALLGYDPETGCLFWNARDGAKSWNTRYAGREAFTAASHGYRRGRIFDRSYPAHRVAWAIYYGEWPNGSIDHINGDPSDNRIHNLRIVSALENSRNSRMPSHNTSGAIGVSWNNACQKWQAYIAVRRKKINLGFFGDKSEAIAARKSAELAYGFHPNHGRIK